MFYELDNVRETVQTLKARAKSEPDAECMLLRLLDIN